MKKHSSLDSDYIIEILKQERDLARDICADAGIPMPKQKPTTWMTTEYEKTTQI